MHSKDGVDIVYARPASFQIQNGGYVIRVYCSQRNDELMVRRGVATPLT